MSASSSQVSELLSILPFEQSVVVLALALTSFLLAPILIDRVGLPGIVGIVLAGTALGPNGLGVLTHSAAIVLLGDAGLVYLLFIVGLELDLRRFFSAPGDAALFGGISFGLPFVVGTGVCMWVLGFDVWGATLLSAVFATHTLLAYPVVNRLGVTKNPAVTAVFGGIIFTDTAGLVVLVLSLGVIQDGLTLWLVGSIAVGLVVLFGGIWLVVPRVARWFFRNTNQESYFEFLFVGALIFGAAGLAEGLGLASITGAFVAGIALNRQIARTGTLINRIEFLGNALFIPFFLFHVGMLVDPTVVVAGTETLWIAAVILGVMFSTKVLAAAGVARIKGYSRNETGVAIGLSVGQAAAALAITLLGFEADVFAAEVLNAVVVMILVSAVVSPWVTERYGRRLAGEKAVEGKTTEPYDPRVLLPTSRTADNQRRLLDLAFVLKDDPPSTPVHLLTVLGPDASDEALTGVERHLRTVAEDASAAEVPVEIETRVDHNVASGVVRTAVETRADLVLLGRGTTRSVGERVFGDSIDQVRDQTTDPVLVARVGRPINTTSRILLVLPPGIAHHEGFPETVYLIKRLAGNLGVPLRAIAVGGDPSPETYERLIDEVDPESSVSVDAVENWTGVRERLSEANRSDLVVPIKPRKGGLGWVQDLQGLPDHILDAPPETFVVVTPRRGEPGYPARFLRLD